MNVVRTRPARGMKALEKARTGIDGFDEITLGGLPRGRTSLVCGSAGCGKTLFAMEFLVRGAQQFGEPGLFMAFEETGAELNKNVASLGFDLEGLEKKDLIRVDHVHIDRSEIQETGEYDLEGLFIRLGQAIDEIGAKRVVLDTLEVIFSGFSNPAFLRSELKRLFRWLNDRGVTAIVTGERGEGPAFTRQGLEEFVSDCVIVLDHRVTEQLSTRRLRVVKYRGSTHGTNEYPFIIDERGISVLPVTSSGLNYETSTERVPSGLAGLDEMLGGQGFYRGSSVLVSGTAGTGKSSLGASFARAATERGERALYCAFEEAQGQIVRNMQAIGVDLVPAVKKGLLKFHTVRPSRYGLETHLAVLHRLVEEFKPDVMVLDPITNLITAGLEEDVKAMLSRLIDFLKNKRVTAVFNSLTTGGAATENSSVGISSLMDAWILLRDVERNGERNRLLHILKARGIGHSNQVREYLITGQGLQLQKPYLGTGEVLTGSARVAQETLERSRDGALAKEFKVKQQGFRRKQAALRAQIAALEADLEAERLAMEASGAEEVLRAEAFRQEADDMAFSRKAGSVSSANGNGKHAKRS